MATKVPVNNLSQNGFVPDVPSNLLPLNAFNYVRNWRWDNGVPYVTPGFIDGLQYGADVSILPSTGTFLLEWSTRNTQQLFYWDNETKRMFIMEEVNDVIEVRDVSPVGEEHPINIDFTWQGFIFSDIPVFNNTKEIPFYYNDATKRLTPLPNFPYARTNFITAFNNILVGLGAEEDQQLVFWSDAVEQPGTVDVSWDPVTLTGEAGFNDLGGLTQGELTSAGVVNGVVLLYSTIDTIATTFVGGIEIFNFANIFSDNGIYSADSRTAIPNGELVLGNSQIYTTDGNTKNLIGEDKWRESIFRDINDDRRDEVQIIYNQPKREAWFIIPTLATNKLVYVYTFDDQNITILDNHSAVGYAIFAENGIPARELTYETIPEEWNYGNIPVANYGDLGVLAKGQFPQSIISVSNGDKKTLYVHDLGNDYDGTAIGAILRRDDIAANGNTYSVTQISRIKPEIYNTGTVNIRVGKYFDLNADPIFESRLFTSGVSQKVDFRSTGRYHSISFESSSPGLILTGYEISFMQKYTR